MEKHRIRDSETTDLAAITAIYAHHVLHNTGTFETEPPSQSDMASRRLDVLSKDLPYLVLEAPNNQDNTGQGNTVLGFCYANWFKPRPAYRFSAEDSIYIHPDHTGKGIGKALLQALIEHSKTAKLNSLIAVIGDSENYASIALHRNCGFTHVGTLHACGYKFDKCLDVVLMELMLNQNPLPPQTQARSSLFTRSP